MKFTKQSANFAIATYPFLFILILYPCNNVADILGNCLIALSLCHREMSCENLDHKSYMIYNSFNIYVTLCWNEVQTLAVMYILCIRIMDWKILLSNFENIYPVSKETCFWNKMNDKRQDRTPSLGDVTRIAICEQNYGTLDIRSVNRSIALSRFSMDRSLLCERTVPVYISLDVRWDVRDPFLKADKNTWRLKERS